MKEKPLVLVLGAGVAAALAALVFLLLGSEGFAGRSTPAAAASRAPGAAPEPADAQRPPPSSERASRERFPDDPGDSLQEEPHELPPPPPPPQLPAGDPRMRADVARLVQDYLDLVNPPGGAQGPYRDVRIDTARVESLLARFATLGEGAVPYMLEILQQNSNRAVRFFLVQGLARIDHESALRGLEWVLVEHPDITLRSIALSEVERSRARGADDMLVRAYRSLGASPGTPDRQAPVRASIVLTLVHRQAPALADFLLEVSRGDPSAHVRATAISALARSDDPRAARFVEEIALDRGADPDVRGQAFIAHARLSGEAGIPALETVLRDETDVRLRACAVAALGSIGQPSVIPVLEGIAASDPSPEVRGRARDAAAALRRRADEAADPTGEIVHPDPGVRLVVPGDGPGDE